MIKGRNIDKNVFTVKNTTVFDLSGAAAAETVIINPLSDIRINSVSVYYEEATSADAGVAINLGNVASATTYGTFTTEVSKAIGYVKTYEGGELTLDTVTKATPLIIAHAGSKTGTGTCYVVVTYTVL